VLAKSSEDAVGGFFFLDMVEDVVQNALFQVYRQLDNFDGNRTLTPWLFRIAHNRCIDFLRSREVRQEAEAAVMEPDSVMPADPSGPIIGRAVEHLVLALPPKERACVLLKDVFDHSLEEIAELVESTVGGVKAALNRGRSKLASLPQPSTSPRAVNPEMSGTSSLRRTTRMIGMRSRRRFCLTPTFTAGPASCSRRQAATATTFCSIE
jgi:RNA polymerase sigma factor (sigma-70 family)